MIDKNNAHDGGATSSPQELRQQAEARLYKKTMLTPEHVEAMTPEATRQLVHELRVHQIELEMQNEELRDAQAALDIVRTRYFDLYDLAPVGYCTISEQGLIVQANLSAASLLGVTRSALVKQPLTRFIYKEDEDIYYLHRRKLIEGGESQSCELRMVKHDGTQVWVHLTTTVAQDADGARELRAVLSDITERKQDEQALRDSERHFREVIDSLPVAIYLTDAEGFITHFNQAAVKLAGRVPMLGKDQWCVSWKLFRPDGMPLAIDACPMAIALKGGHPVPGTEAIAERPDGTRVWVTPYPIALRDACGKLTGGINMLVDITERKQIETDRQLLNQILQDKNTDLQHAMVATDKANRAKSEFLSSMSHELRTPLNAILGFAQLLESSTPPPSAAQKQSLDHILKAGWYLLALINEILDLAVIESGKLSLSMEVVSLADVMLECEAMIESQAHHRGIDMTYPRFDKPLFVNADHIRVKQVLINLLSNAIKYNRAGGTVLISCIESSSGRIRISVEDTGAGLASDQLAQLFQPFNRLGKEEGAVEGTGIGLVVSKRIVELMQGSIGVESTVGKGSVFWIELTLTA